jgi:hypothetical protein
MKFSLMIIHEEFFSDIINVINQNPENFEQDISDHLQTCNSSLWYSIKL